MQFLIEMGIDAKDAIQVIYCEYTTNYHDLRAARAMSFDLEKARDVAKYDDCEALRLFPEALTRIDELEIECDTLTNSLIDAQAEMGARLQVAKEQQAKDIATIDHLRAMLIEERAAVIHNFDVGGFVWGWDVLNNEIRDKYRKQAARELGFEMRL